LCAHLKIPPVKSELNSNKYIINSHMHIDKQVEEYYPIVCFKTINFF